MPSSSMPWVKIDTDILEDPKVGKLTESANLRFYQLIVVAGKCDAEGYLVNGEDPLSIDDIGWILHKDSETIKSDLEELEAMELVIFDEELNAFLVTNFAKRQGRPQHEKRKQWRERQRRYREKKRDSRVEDGTSHVSVTDDSNVTYDDVTAPEERRVEGEKEGEEELKGANAPQQQPKNLDEWHQKLKNGSNKQAILREMTEILYPYAVEYPDFSYIGRVARKVGGAGRLASLLWECAPKRPTGDILSYVQAFSKNKKPSKEEPAGFAGLRDYAEEQGWTDGE